MKSYRIFTSEENAAAFLRKRGTLASGGRLSWMGVFATSGRDIIELLWAHWKDVPKPFWVVYYDDPDGTTDMMSVLRERAYDDIRHGLVTDK